MPKAKTKSKSSKVAEKVEVVKKSPPKPVQPTKDILVALDEPYNQIFEKAIEQVGEDLGKLREHIIKEDGSSQANLQAIIKEIDKYLN
tara:strand:+ start:238 stop:501 length:264 start_codon:yes stop_codon:yes gene_type:complete